MNPTVSWLKMQWLLGSSDPLMFTGKLSHPDDDILRKLGKELIKMGRAGPGSHSHMCKIVN